MGDIKKTPIIKDALTDYNAIVEAADANAKKRLADEFPQKFTNLVNEELNKNKDKSKESYKKLEDNDKESDMPDKENSNKESDMTKQKKETKKVDENEKGMPFEKEKANVEETVVIKDTVGDPDPFTDKVKGEKKVDEAIKNTEPFTEKVKSESEVVDETVAIKDTVGDPDPFTDKVKGEKKVDETVVIKDTVGDPDPFTDKVKGEAKKKGKENIEEAFDISELDMDSVERTLETAGEEDTISFDEIEEEIARLDGLEEELQGMKGLPRPEANFGTPKGQGGDVFTNKLTAVKNQIDEIIAGLGGGVAENVAPVAENVAPVSENAEEEVITNADIDSVLNGGGEQPVDEVLGVSHATNKISSANNPRSEFASSKAAAERRRPGFNENKTKRVSGLVNENKKLTKKLNEIKKSNTTAINLVESYKNALTKYRNQLKEMAVFNTNLAHVNNLLVNESIALTQNDKIKIINEFKKVDSITASQDKYKSLLSEMKEGKKTIRESIEDKVSTSIQPSSKQKLDEVVENTAYANNEHINKMKSLMEYMEKRGNKKLL